MKINIWSSFFLQNMEIKKLLTAGLVSLKDGKLLLAFSKNKKAWYLPGGKLDLNEDSKSALVREILEELNVHLEIEKLDFLMHISAHAYGENQNIIMEQDCYRYDLQEPIIPSNEILDIGYFSEKEYLQQPIHVEGVLIVFNKLKDLQLI